MKSTAAIALTLLLIVAALGAQAKRVPAPADYGQFESLGPGGGLSPDGAWTATAIARSSRDHELRIVKVADGTATAIAFGSQPIFSADSKWAGYRIGMSESAEDKLRTEKKPIHNKAGLLDLQRGEKSVVDDIESFAFNAAGSYV